MRRRNLDHFEQTETPYIITFEERVRLVRKALLEGGSVSIALIASILNTEIADTVAPISYDDVALVVRKLVDSGEVIRIPSKRRDYFMLAPVRTIVESKKPGKRPGRPKACTWRNGGIVQ